MRLLTTLLLTTASICATQAEASHASAGEDLVLEGGTVIGLTLQVDGTAFDDSGTRVRLCPDGYDFIATTRAPSIELPPGPDPGLWRTVDGIDQVLYWTLCLRTERDDEVDGRLRVIDERQFWVGRPTTQAIVPTLIKRLQGIIDPPIVSWPTMDPEFGWLYVNANMEFRVAALAPITVSGELTNIVDTASATITATPTSVTFYSGEPSRGTTTCSVADAAAPFHIDIIGACAYKYKAASSVAANGRTFNTRMVVNWEVTGDLQPDTPRTLETYAEAPIAVAEVQALVCANPGC